MVQLPQHAGAYRPSETSPALAGELDYMPVAAQSTVAAVAKAMIMIPSNKRRATLRRIYAAWIRRTEHRRELDTLLRHGEPMFRDIGVTRDEVLTERQRPLSDFM